MLERRLQVLSWLLACVWLWLSACGDSHGMGGAGSETNWLRACDGNTACGEGDCVCGVCSAECGDDDDCPNGLVCKREASELYEQTCGIDLEVQGLCAPECERDADCSDGQSCSDGACTPASVASGGASDAGGGMGMAPPDSTSPPAGARQLIIDAHLALTPECAPDLEMPIGSGVGAFDIATGGRDETEGCGKPYMLTLRVQNLADEGVLVTDVEVVLGSIQDERIFFSRNDPPAPNPFALSVTGSVPAAVDGDPGRDAIIVEAIPANYALQLDGFVGGQIAIRAQLSGETVSGTPVHSNVFEYRVGICYGCLSMCMSPFSGPEADPTVEDLVGGECNDNAGADGRYCFDPEC